MFSFPNSNRPVCLNTSSENTINFWRSLGIKFKLGGQYIKHDKDILVYYANTPKIIFKKAANGVKQLSYRICY